MRLWHEQLLHFLPRQQLLGQHRECAALLGAGWGKPHATVNYVFDYSPYYLYRYHLLVMEEMENRGYKPDTLWKDVHYRGKVAEPYDQVTVVSVTSPIYPEHNDDYMTECLENLAEKGIFLKMD